MAHLDPRRIPPTHPITPTFDLLRDADFIAIHNLTPVSRASLDLAHRTHNYLHRLPSYAAVPALPRAANIIMLAKLADSEAAGRPAPGAARRVWLDEPCVCQYRHDAYELANGLSAPMREAEAEAAAFLLTRLRVARDAAELAFLLGEVARPMAPPRRVLAVVILPVIRLPGGWVEEGEREAECPVCLEEYVDEGEGERRVRLRACGHVMGERCAWEHLSQDRRCPLCRAVLYGWYPARHGSTELEARPMERRIQ